MLFSMRKKGRKMKENVHRSEADACSLPVMLRTYIDAGILIKMFLGIAQKLNN